MSQCEVVDQVVGWICTALEMSLKVFVWISLPCTAWSTWQRVNWKCGGEATRQKICAEQEDSYTLLRELARALQQVYGFKQRVGGVVYSAKEWPRYCAGWKVDDVKEMIGTYWPWSAQPDGCAFGLSDDGGRPLRKQWTIYTDCLLYTSPSPRD